MRFALIDGGHASKFKKSVAVTPRLVGIVLAGAIVAAPVLGAAGARSSDLAPQLTALQQCPAYGASHFSGYTTPPATNIRGSRADIEYMNPDLCGSDSDGQRDSLAWAMIQADSATYPNNLDAGGWAQAGYGQFAYKARSTDASNIGIATFTQWTRKCKATLSCGSDSTVVTVYDRTNPGGH